MKAAFKALTVVVFCVFLAGCGKAGEHEDSGVLHTADASQSGFTAASGEGGETQEDVSGGDVSENGTANITESEDGQVSEDVQCADDCDDGLWCNGQEVCISGVCVRGNAPDCSMSNACYIGSCNEKTDTCDSAQNLNVADKDRDTHLSLTCGGGDCDDLDKYIHPEADEKCDTVDNNCDGSIDENCVCEEGVTQLCGRDEGACESGTQTCVVGNDGRTFWAPCTGKAPSAEMCDFIDNDCDGLTDEDFDLTRDPQNCRVCNRICWPGEICEKGRCLAENGELPDAGIEDDSGVDAGRDADGGVDAGPVCVSSTEICDAKDNDCDGQTDEGLSQICFTACGDGMEICESGQWTNCMAQQIITCTNYTTCQNEPTCVTACPPVPTEICDAKDNDCDGTVDEDFANKGQSCTVGVGECVRTGTYVCKTDKTGTVCSANPGNPITETCDSKDNDCDSQLDGADADLVLTNCEKQNGVCNGKKHSASQCVSGQWQTCTATEYGSDYESAETRCDSKDNDCDGVVDEGVKNTYYRDADGDGYGANSQTTTACSAPASYVSQGGDCADGDASMAPNKPELCDAKDNDCDGTVDEAVSRSCGSGQCTGIQTCTAGAWSSCGTSGADCGTCCKCSSTGVETFDSAQDSDCASTVCPASACGLNCGTKRKTIYPASVANECSSLKSCTNRTCNFTCEADADADSYSTSCGDCNDNDRLIYQGASELCNSKDDDCDGLIDAADPNLELTNCEKQDGVCNGKKHSASQCVSGQWQSCTATEYGSDYEAVETLCDNKDNDCVCGAEFYNDNGTCKRIYRDCSTSCGAGIEQCYSGEWKFCTAPQPSEEIYGDARDNDCDGQTDEELRFLPCATVPLAGTYSFDTCHIKSCTTLAVSSTINLTCRVLTIEQGGTIRANGVGDAGSCNGGNGQGGGPSACGGGGGGACSAGIGGVGGYCPWRAVGIPGAGGVATYGTASGADQFAGSRGGNGGIGTTVYNPIQPGTFNYGALGGGIIAITVTESATIGGTIAVKGGDGDQRGWNICDDGAGGGGSGGAILFRTPLLIFGTSALITASGGKGGKGGTSCGPGGGGGGGGGGRVKIKIMTQAVFNGSTYNDTSSFLSAAGANITASGGAGGDAGGAGAEPGQAGQNGTVAPLSE